MTLTSSSVFFFDGIDSLLYIWTYMIEESFRSYSRRGSEGFCFEVNFELGLDLFFVILGFSSILEL